MPFEPAHADCTVSGTRYNQRMNSYLAQEPEFLIHILEDMYRKVCFSIHV